MPTASDPSPERNGANLEVAHKPPTSRPQGRRQAGWFLLAAVLVAGLAAYLFANRPARTQESAAIRTVPTATIRTGSVERVLRITGQTSARHFASITVTRFLGQPGASRGGNLVLTKLAEGGSMVKTGDVVAELDAETMMTAIEASRTSNELLELELSRLKAQQALDWETIQQTVRSAKANYDRAALDYKKADVQTAVERELLKLALEQNEAVYKQQLFALDFKKISMAASMRSSELQFERVRVVLDRLLNDMRALTFRAPMDGMVVLQSVERTGGTQAQYAVGDAVSPGRSFMRIVDLSDMQLDGMANQTASSAIRVGQPATVTLDAFPDLTFKGRVYSVGAMARASRFESYYFRSVPVVIQIEGSHPRLLPDMSGAADVLLESSQDKPLVPLEAVRSEDGRAFVYLRGPKGFEKRYVEIGVRGTIEGAVLSGLRAGDVVALAEPPPAIAGS